MKQRIVFFGAGNYTVPVVEKLINHGLDLVVTTEKDLQKSKLLKFCKENNIRFEIASNASDLSNLKSEISNYTLAILASYGAFIPDEIIKMFPNGIINIHPSLLPKYKGPTPIQTALLNGDTQTGVTLIKLDNEIDHGPILLQKPYELIGNETTEDLLSILFEIGAEMIEEIVVKLENNEVLNETPQNHEHETWSYKIEKEDGKIKLSNTPNKEKLKNMIRAYFPWPGVWFTTNLKGQTKIVKLLPEDKIQVEGKNVMNFKDFINGYGNEGKNILLHLHLI